MVYNLFMPKREETKVYSRTKSVFDSKEHHYLKLSDVATLHRGRQKVALWDLLLITYHLRLEIFYSILCDC